MGVVLFQKSSTLIACTPRLRFILFCFVLLLACTVLNPPPPSYSSQNPALRSLVDAHDYIHPAAWTVWFSVNCLSVSARITQRSDSVKYGGGQSYI